MRTRPFKASPDLSARTAFSLVELLIVLVILAILIGLLFPVLGGIIVNRAKVEVRTDMMKIKDSITQFKVIYGIDPPSNITLYPPGTVWADARSVGLIQQMWPQFDFSQSGGMSAEAFPGGPSNPQPLELNGSECLVFFLGGIPDVTNNGGTLTGSGALSGFSKNPRLPFSLGGNREGPFYEFGTSGVDISNGQFTGRLIDSYPSNKAPELLDTLDGQTLPLVYFSSYDGEGYRADENATAPQLLQVPYFQDANGNTPYNKSTFQIVSAGFDFGFGVGGEFKPENASTLFTGNRKLEADNLTNFHDGQLNE